MNSKRIVLITFNGFRPQQGLPIINKRRWIKRNTWNKGFRPQQGLPIINYRYLYIYNICEKLKFPSPTGVTYYKSSVFNQWSRFSAFPSPTGVTYYKWLVVLYLIVLNLKKFPSPTGVTYYKLSKIRPIGFTGIVSVPNRGYLL